MVTCTMSSGRGEPVRRHLDVAHCKAKVDSSKLHLTGSMQRYANTCEL